MKTPGLSWTCLPLLLGLVVCPTAVAQDEGTPSQPELAWEVYHILHRHCAECHGGHRSKPKGGFGYVLDLDRISNDPKFVIPGKPDDSEIYLLMTDPDPDFRMPPPDSDARPVTEADQAIVRDWILGGAGLGPAGPAPDPAASPSGSEAAKGATGFLSLIAWLHPLVVHFPIALILAALGAELLGLREAARWCLWIGALGAVAAVSSGWLAAGAEGYSPVTVFRHRWLAVAATGCALASAVLLEIARRRTAGKGAMVLARLILLLAAVLVGLAGHTGGVLVHGAWPKGL